MKLSRAEPMGAQGFYQDFGGGKVSYCIRLGVIAGDVPCWLDAGGKAIISVKDGEQKNLEAAYQAFIKEETI